jgi:RNA polymerase sigma-70 factor (ECF subfamily)
MDEKNLIASLINGEESAYLQLVSSYQGLMVQVARAIVGDAIAEEVVQESWLSVMKALPKFEGRSQLKTWILRIVSNTAKTRLRKESRMTAVGGAEELQTMLYPDQRFDETGHWSTPPRRWHSEQPDELLASEQLQKIIQQAICDLPSNQRAVLTLREMEGLAVEDVCNILDISESNVRVLLHRARAKIWQTIESSEV